MSSQEYININRIIISGSIEDPKNHSLDTSAKVNEKLSSQFNNSKCNYFVDNIIESKDFDKDNGTNNGNKIIRLIVNENIYTLQEKTSSNPVIYSQFDPPIGTSIYVINDKKIYILTSLVNIDLNKIQTWNEFQSSGGSSFDPNETLYLTNTTSSLETSGPITTKKINIDLQDDYVNNQKYLYKMDYYILDDSENNYYMYRTDEKNVYTTYFNDYYMNTYVCKVNNNNFELLFNLFDVYSNKTDNVFEYLLGDLYDPNIEYNEDYQMYINDYVVNKGDFYIIHSYNISSTSSSIFRILLVKVSKNNNNYNVNILYRFDIVEQDYLLKYNNDKLYFITKSTYDNNNSIRIYYNDQLYANGNTEIISDDEPLNMYLYNDELYLLMDNNIIEKYTINDTSDLEHYPSGKSINKDTTYNPSFNNNIDICESYIINYTNEVVDIYNLNDPTNIIKTFNISFDELTENESFKEISKIYYYNEQLCIKYLYTSNIIWYSSGYGCNINIYYNDNTKNTIKNTFILYNQDNETSYFTDDYYDLFKLNNNYICLPIDYEDDDHNPWPINYYSNIDVIKKGINIENYTIKSSENLNIKLQDNSLNIIDENNNGTSKLYSNKIHSSEFAVGENTTEQTINLDIHFNNIFDYIPNDYVIINQFVDNEKVYFICEYNLTETNTTSSHVDLIEFDYKNNKYTNLINLYIDSNKFETSSYGFSYLKQIGDNIYIIFYYGSNNDGFKIDFISIIKNNNTYQKTIKEDLLYYVNNEEFNISNPYGWILNNYTNSSLQIDDNYLYIYAEDNNLRNTNSKINSLTNEEGYKILKYNYKDDNPEFIDITSSLIIDEDTYITDILVYNNIFYIITLSFIRNLEEDETDTINIYKYNDPTFEKSFNKSFIITDDMPFIYHGLYYNNLYLISQSKNYIEVYDINNFNIIDTFMINFDQEIELSFDFHFCYYFDNILYYNFVGYYVPPYLKQYYKNALINTIQDEDQHRLYYLNNKHIFMVKYNNDPQPTKKSNNIKDKKDTLPKKELIKSIFNKSGQLIKKYDENKLKTENIEYFYYLYTPNANKNNVNITEDNIKIYGNLELNTVKNNYELSLNNSGLKSYVFENKNIFNWGTNILSNKIVIGMNNNDTLTTYYNLDNYSNYTQYINYYDNKLYFIYVIQDENEKFILYLYAYDLKLQSIIELIHFDLPNNYQYNTYYLSLTIKDHKNIYIILCDRVSSVDTNLLVYQIYYDETTFEYTYDPNNVETNITVKYESKVFVSCEIYDNTAYILIQNIQNNENNVQLIFYKLNETNHTFENYCILNTNDSDLAITYDSRYFYKENDYLFFLLSDGSVYTEGSNNNVYRYFNNQDNPLYFIKKYIIEISIDTDVINIYDINHIYYEKYKINITDLIDQILSLFEEPPFEPSVGSIVFTDICEQDNILICSIHINNYDYTNYIITFNGIKTKFDDEYYQDMYYYKCNCVDIKYFEVEYQYFQKIGYMYDNLYIIYSNHNAASSSNEFKYSIYSPKLSKIDISFTPEKTTFYDNIVIDSKKISFQTGTIENDPVDNKDIVNKKYVDDNNVGKKEYVNNELKGEIFNVYSGDNKNTATGNYSHAEGYRTEASGSGGSHAEGAITVASGYGSHASGLGTFADQRGMTAIGKYNTKNNNNSLFVVGNGIDDTIRNDAIIIKDTGECIHKGDVKIYGQINKVDNLVIGESIKSSRPVYRGSISKDTENNINIYKAIYNYKAAPNTSDDNADYYYVITKQSSTSYNYIFKRYPYDNINNNNKLDMGTISFNTDIDLDTNYVYIPYENYFILIEYGTISYVYNNGSGALTNLYSINRQYDLKNNSNKFFYLCREDVSSIPVDMTNYYIYTFNITITNNVISILNQTLIDISSIKDLLVNYNNYDKITMFVISNTIIFLNCYDSTNNKTVLINCDISNTSAPSLSVILQKQTGKCRITWNRIIIADDDYNKIYIKQWNSNYVLSDVNIYTFNSNTMPSLINGMFAYYEFFYYIKDNKVYGYNINSEIPIINISDTLTTNFGNNYNLDLHGRGSNNFILYGFNSNITEEMTLKGYYINKFYNETDFNNTINFNNNLNIYNKDIILHGEGYDSNGSHIDEKCIIKQYQNTNKKSFIMYSETNNFEIFAGNYNLTGNAVGFKINKDDQKIEIRGNTSLINNYWLYFKDTNNGIRVNTSGSNNYFQIYSTNQLEISNNVNFNNATVGFKLIPSTTSIEFKGNTTFKNTLTVDNKDFIIKGASTSTTEQLVMKQYNFAADQSYIIYSSTNGIEMYSGGATYAGSAAGYQLKNDGTVNIKGNNGINIASNTTFNNNLTVKGEIHNNYYYSTKTEDANNEIDTIIQPTLWKIERYDYTQALATPYDNILIQSKKSKAPCIISYGYHGMSVYSTEDPDSSISANTGNRGFWFKYKTKIEQYGAIDIKNSAGNVSNQTITHNMPIIDNIENYQIGMPVFISNDNKSYLLQEREGNNCFEYVDISDNVQDYPTDPIPKVQLTDNNKFIGIITGIYDTNEPYLEKTVNASAEIYINCPTVQVSTHGDYIFKVNDNTALHNTTAGTQKIYEIGDNLLYDGTIIDPNTPLTYNLMHDYVGIITCVPTNNTDYVSVFKC